MVLRHSVGKMRRDSSCAASLQPDHPVDERGKTAGAPGLAVGVEHRVLARIRGRCRSRGDAGQWVRERRRFDRLRGQDKSRKVQPVGRLENARDFKHAANIAEIRHTLRFLQCRCSCSAFNTLWLMREPQRRFFAFVQAAFARRAVARAKPFLVKAPQAAQKTGRRSLARRRQSRRRVRARAAPRALAATRPLQGVRLRRHGVRRGFFLNSMEDFCFVRRGIVSGFAEAGIHRAATTMSLCLDQPRWCDQHHTVSSRAS